MKIIFLIAFVISITSGNTKQKDIYFGKIDTAVQKQRPKLFNRLFERIDEQNHIDYYNDLDTSLDETKTQ